MIPEMEKELASPSPTPIAEEKAKILGTIDLMNIPKGSRALTADGRTYEKAAEHLITIQTRRAELFKEYAEAQAKLRPIIQEIIVNHQTIDAIVDELARS